MRSLIAVIPQCGRWDYLWWRCPTGHHLPHSASQMIQRHLPRSAAEHLLRERQLNLVHQICCYKFRRRTWYGSFLILFLIQIPLRLITQWKVLEVVDHDPPMTTFIANVKRTSVLWEMRLERSGLFCLSVTNEGLRQKQHHCCSLIKSSVWNNREVEKHKACLMTLSSNANFSLERPSFQSNTKHIR